MNKAYRLVWSDIQQSWVVTHEHVRSRGKRSSGQVGALIAGALLAPLLNAAQPVPPPPNALPTGGQVVAGQAAISQAGSTLNIRQATHKAILNWQSFNIGSNATVNFQQPNASAVALNRVLGNDPSAIYGRLNANGQVFLVNPNGVLFGSTARVDVAGLVATTMNIRNEDFLTGNYRFTRDGATGAVVNQGEIVARYAALLAPEVRNEGIVVARMGTAAFAAGESVTLGITGERLVDVEVEKAAINTLVENRHLVQVDAGTVVMSAQSVNALLGRTVNSGTVAANGIDGDGGIVRIAASHSIDLGGTVSANAGARGEGGRILAIADLANGASRTTVTGTLIAKGGTQSGNGGFIETSANILKIADTARIDTSAPFGATGQWLLDPHDFTIAAANGDITGTALSTALASNNVTIQTLGTSGGPPPTVSGVSCTNATCGTGNSSGNGDIFVNDNVTWSSDKTLTLSAWRNIHINAPVSVNGAGGGLALHFAQSDTAANFPPGIYTVSAPVNLAASTTFSTKAATDGPVINYTVIRDAAALAAISGNLAGSYVLGTDITAPVTSWTPIGNTATPFMGIFDGLGHKVDGLQHTNAGADVDVGLFGNVGAAGLIQNVGVTNVNIAGSQNVGALAGYNNGFIINSYATGTVQGTGTGDVGRIGGLVGFSMGPIQGSYANVTVTATSGNQSNDPMMMENPLSTGRGGIGGLAGVVGTSLSDSYARGAVTGVDAVGGLVGYSAAGINNSYSTGAVIGTTNANGLIGQVFDPNTFTPFVFNSFWDTTTSGKTTGGGGTADSITGRNTAQMQTPSTFTGAGWDTSFAWELRSNQYPLIKPMLQAVYVIADNKTSTFNGSAFTAFTSTTGPTGTPGGATTGSVTYTPSTANPTNAGSYTVTPGGVSVAAAGAGDQHGYRVEFVNGTLTITPAVLTTTITGSLVGSVSKVYDGSSTITGLTNANFSLSGWQGGDGATVTKTTGTITDGPNASASTTRPVTVTLVTGDFTPDGGTLFSNYTLPTSVSGNIGQITPKTVTLSATKTYDGSTTLTGSQVTITTGVAGEALTYSGATANSKNVADNATNFISAITLQDGTGGLASNYQKPVLNAANAPVTVNKAPLTVTADNQTRTFGAANPVFTQTISGFVGGENLATSGVTGAASTFGSSTANASTGVGNAAILASATGLSAANYDFTTLVNGTLTITPAMLTAITANLTGTTTKVYDGTDGVTGLTPANFRLTGWQNMDGGDVTVTKTMGTYADANVGSNKNVTVALASGDFNATTTNLLNYTLPATASGAIGTITPKPISALTLTAAPSYQPLLNVVAAGDKLTGAQIASVAADTTIQNLLTLSGESLVTPTSATVATASRSGANYNVTYNSLTGLGLTGRPTSNFTLTNPVVSGQIATSGSPATGSPRLLLRAQPPTTLMAGDPFSLQVAIADASNAVFLTGTSSTLTISLAGSGLGPAASLSQTAVGGIATFSGLRFFQANSNPTPIAVSATGVTSATTSPITVTANTTPQYVAFTAQPTYEVTGITFSQQPRVQAFNSQGNVATTATGTVTLTLQKIGGTTTAILSGPASGPVTANIVAGVASFSGLRITGVDRNLRLVITFGNLTSSSNVIDVFGDAVSAVTQQTSSQAQIRSINFKLNLDASVIDLNAKKNFESQIKSDLCTAAGLSAASCNIVVTLSKA